MFMDMAMLVESQVIAITYIDVLIIVRVLSKFCHKKKKTVDFKNLNL